MPKAIGVGGGERERERLAGRRECAGLRLGRENGTVRTSCMNV